MRGDQATSATLNRLSIAMVPASDGTQDIGQGGGVALYDCEAYGIIVYRGMGEYSPHPRGHKPRYDVARVRYPLVAMIHWHVMILSSHEYPISRTSI